MDYQTILVTVESRITTAILNRPGCSNAFARGSYVEMADAMRDLGSREDVGSVVITGMGRHFSAGGDIKHFKVLIDSKECLDRDSVADTGDMSVAIRERPRPIIAVINGVATGTGLSYALACDFRVVAPSSKMIMAFVNMGFYGGTGSIYNLIRLIDPDKVELLIMTGDTCHGGDCVRMGLATLLAEGGRLQGTTYNLASKLVGKPSAAHVGQKRLTEKYFYREPADSAVDEGKEIAAASCLPGFTGTVNAFLGKGTSEYDK